MTPLAQCTKNLDFRPRLRWSSARPAYAWEDHLLCAFERSSGFAVDLAKVQGASLPEAVKATHPILGLSELARLTQSLQNHLPQLFLQSRVALFAEYSQRWSERLQQTLDLLVQTPIEFQDWVDRKSLGARDVSVLLALPEVKAFAPFLLNLTTFELSRSEGVRAIELAAELFMMGRPLQDLLPEKEKVSGQTFLRNLESWRRPRTSAGDAHWAETVERWPWPSQVQGRWQRFGDQAGLEIQIRSHSPDDLHKKLKNLISIGDTWNDQHKS